MKWAILGILLICWLIPCFFMIGILGVSVASRHSEMTAQNFGKQLSFNTQLCTDRLDAAIDASRQLSYDGAVLSANEQYRRGKLTRYQAQQLYRQQLCSRYQNLRECSAAFLWFPQEEAPALYSVYNQSAGATYQQVLDFEAEDYEAAEIFARTLGTRAGFLFGDCGLYLVRNLADSAYTRQGTLVLRLCEDYCFSSLKHDPSLSGIRLLLNEEEFFLKESSLLSTKLQKETGVLDASCQWSESRLYATDSKNGKGYTLTASVLFCKEISPFPFYRYPYILGAMLFSFIPMLLLMLLVFQRQVSRPVSQLSSGALHIEKGELGYQLQTRPQNLEFAYLQKAFNHMSCHLKQQFDQIYQEETALREARIMALQSHINPHFLNNTLEIINWEARLCGSTRVSRMIEALSTMLDAALDRNRRPQVSLAEEMHYVNSYLYITKERLGKRLSVTCSIPDKLMHCQVPRLILQPVVENAVEHGIVPNGSGTIEIRGYCDEACLYLETVNTGGLSPADEARIARLLAPDYNPRREPASSLGIANVNQRLSILFGQPCGLTIKKQEQQKVCALLTLPLSPSESPRAVLENSAKTGQQFTA